MYNRKTIVLIGLKWRMVIFDQLQFDVDSKLFSIACFSDVEPVKNEVTRRYRFQGFLEVFLCLWFVRGF